jgi:hypothetical protein
MLYVLGGVNLLWLTGATNGCSLISLQFEGIGSEACIAVKKGIIVG